MHFLVAGIALLFMRGIDNQLMVASLETYWFIAKIVVALTTVTALSRILLNQVSFGSYNDLKYILRKSITFLVFIAVLPTVIQIAVKFVDETSHKIVQESHLSQINNLYDQNKSKLNFETQEWSIKDFMLISKFYDAARADFYQSTVRMIVIFIAETLQYIRDMTLAVFIALSPIFLYLGLLVGISFFSNAVLTLGATLLIWPLVSAVILHFSMIVFNSKSESYWTSLSQANSLLIYGAFQLLLPFLVLGSGLMAASSVKNGVMGVASKFMNRGK